ncbi:hypothetical protein B0H17DRAFT_1202578 [Mycena rosella]|uniref:Uncharacterized protein n=1 Tax=Mycena rosella TaxID=1033263 RepID=A0AAD7DDT8_MYCRO|nr:hypothetical protein B0H17DRAFT_1202578 [Mycena rosella]
MRPLSLHTSALNDAEYTLFTENLGSLLDSDGDDPEAQTLTIREVRAWMRGRYPGVPAATIDRILALFPSKEAIHGGEFFAALRLVLHVESGKDVDRALAFVQVHPGSAAAVPAAAPVSAPAAAASEKVALPPSPEAPPETILPRSPQRYNPFLPPTPALVRSKTAPSPSAPVLPPRKAPAPPAAPVPPPRHPPLPPRAASPPKPSTPAHITSTLMKQSLQASKTGQWMKQGQARLEQERVLQVLRSSSITPRPAAPVDNDYASSSSSDGSRSRPARSIPPSVSSLEQVALASPSPALQRAFDDVYRDREAALPPPMHPDRQSAPSSRASASSASSRAHASPERSPARSPTREKPRPPPKPRSLNSAAHSSSPFASPNTQTRLTRSNSLRPSPPPSARIGGRTRPESVHALLGGLGARLAESPFGDPVRPRVRPRGEEREALVARQRALEPEYSDSGPEDGDTDADGGWVGVGRFEDSDADADADSPELGGRRQQRQVRAQSMAAQERDSLKWPVDVEGEGWRPL